MSIFNDVMVELKLTYKEIQNNKELSDFVIAYTKRKYEQCWIQRWNGNAIIEINKLNGTSIRTILTDEEYKPEYPENIDLNISNKCSLGCAFCYQGCTKNGKEADIQKFINDKNSFLYSMQPGSELAINGNEPLHKDLELLLKTCKSVNILANLTVNEVTLLNNKEQIEKWLNKGLIHGIGISPKNYSEEMINWCKEHSTAVIHTIAGITTLNQYKELFDKELKILILGYKDFGRGVSYNKNNTEEINANILALKDSIKEFRNHFNVISFDNLALTQLDIQAILNEDEWDRYYRGEDGNHTFYIDLVKEVYYKNSIQKEGKLLLNDIRKMLSSFREVNNEI